MAKTVTMPLVLHYEREKSIVVSRDGDRDAIVFLPLGEIVWRALPGQWMASGRFKLQIVEVTMPEWLAVGRGLA